SETRDAVGDQLGVFDNVCSVADHAWNQNLARGQLYVFPHFPFVFMAWIRGLDEIGAGTNFQNQIDDIPQRNVGRVRTGPTAPADVIAHTIFRNAFQRVIQQLNVAGEPAMIVIKRSRRDHTIKGNGSAGIVHLKQEAGFDDGLIFSPECVGECDNAFFVAFVVFIFAIRNGARWGGDRQEGLVNFRRLQRVFQIVDIAIQFIEARVLDWGNADRVATCDIRPRTSIGAAV